MKKEMIGFCDRCNSETDTCDAQGRFRCIDCQQSDLIAVAQARKEAACDLGTGKLKPEGGDGLTTATKGAYTGVCRSCAQGGGRLVMRKRQRSNPGLAGSKLKGD